MNACKSFSFFGIATIAAVVICYQGGTSMSSTLTQQKKYNSLISKGITKDGLAAFVFSECNKVKLGQELPIHYGVVNLGEDGRNDPTKIWPIRRANAEGGQSWFTVKGPDGKKIPYGGGNRDFRRFNDPNVAITLLKGDFHGKICPNLFADHKIAKSGEYTIVWTMQVRGAPKGPWEGTLESNEIRVEVVP
jgi:hypothetical protein